MNFQDSVKQCLTVNYMNFSGRTPRSVFWFFVLFEFVGFTVLSLIPFLGLLFAIAMILPGLAVQVRRLHDINWSGWWLLLALTAIGSLFLCVLYCIKGTDGYNRFGPDPLPPTASPRLEKY